MESDHTWDVISSPDMWQVNSDEKQGRRSWVTRGQPWYPVAAGVVSKLLPPNAVYLPTLKIKWNKGAILRTA